MKRLATLCLAIGLVPIADAGAGNTFDANYAKARKNVTTKAGAAFDTRLGLAMQMHAEFQEGFKRCSQRFPKHLAVRGYFSFTSATSYRVILAPKTAFSTCLSRAMEGREVPPPPSLPYLNPFELSASPAGK